MSEQRPSDLSDLPRMIPDRDDISRRQPPHPPTQHRSVRLWPLYGLFFLLLGALGYLGYEGWQLQQQLASTQNDASARLAVLEGQLSATDESLTMNASAIQANFANIGAEIRRLWDVADTRNRDWIRENQATLAEITPQILQLQSAAEQTTAQAEQLLTLQNSVNTALTESQAAATALRELRTQLGSDFAATNAEMKARLDIIEVGMASRSDQITNTQEGLNRLRRQVEEDAANRNALADSLSALANRINQLDDLGNITEIEQLNDRLNAIDITRADTTQRLASMQSQIRALQERLEALQ